MSSQNPIGQKDFLKGLLSNFMFTLGHGIQASSQASPQDAAMAGFGATLQAPEMMRQQQLKEEQARQAAALQQQQVESGTALNRAQIENLFSQIQSRNQPPEPPGPISLPGSNRLVSPTGQVLVPPLPEQAPGPISLPESNRLVDPTTRETLIPPVEQEPKPPSLTPRPVLLDGEPAMVWTSPEGKYFKDGKEIESSRIGIYEKSTQKEDSKNTGLAKTVFANPILYDDLTPSIKAAIAPDLASMGFTGFGKKLSDAAITKLSDSRNAISSLKDLRDILLKNERYIGPVAGWQATNPWSPARQAQSDIDRVRQRVGKAMEGGVLRKEDEEKYKKILATLNDTPSTAIYKVDQIISNLENEIVIFSEEQRKAGRNVSGSTGPGIIEWEKGPDGIPRPKQGPTQ